VTGEFLVPLLAVLPSCYPPSFPLIKKHFPPLKLYGDTCCIMFPESSMYRSMSFSLPVLVGGGACLFSVSLLSVAFLFSSLLLSSLLSD